MLAEWSSWRRREGPASLLTLTPDAAPTGEFTRAANAGQSVTVSTPVVSKELRTTRIPVRVSPTDVQYVTDAQWIDTPDRLFANLVAETIRRTTNRVVLDPGMTGLDPGLIVSGELQEFGFDAGSGQVVVRFDGALSTAGGTRVETRRFEATVPSDGSSTGVGPALNQAANKVAHDVAGWVGNRQAP
ncbi:membrane integrity-associated transporter subunit PqiC [Sphingomonas daechungensis]|uniref:Membrane integrity-associated transporter subunit PqiC n=1 Tax=Sphingomonas daechungensis TaxID=1176646 RepID=A0ABX6SXB1_9SPHN|nr:ABC-type transport auxiliary lipoprotein family protein [Sphingomonas daechungensis]QNP42257.1 membrane integrity-associated transporter subunit PqiC [Sphingomonas daechungensis]